MKYSKYFQLFKHKAKNKYDPPVLPRKYYFEVITSLIGDLRKWLEHKKLIFLQKLETLHLDSAHMHAHTHARRHTHMHAGTHTCTHACMHTHTLEYGE